MEAGGYGLCYRPKTDGGTEGGAGDDGGDAASPADATVD
jgi:hypothetical protein